MDSVKTLITQICEIMKLQMQPGWAKLLLCCQFAPNSFSNALRALSTNGTVLGDLDEAGWNDEDRLNETLSELWDCCRDHAAGLDWDEFVILIDSRGQATVDYYLHEMEHLYSNEKTDFFECKYFGLPLPERLAQVVANPLFKDVKREKTYQRESAPDYQKLHRELAVKTTGELWTAYTGRIKQQYRPCYDNLAAGCSAADLAEFEQNSGLSLPQELKDMYFIHNGEQCEETETSGVFFGLFFMSLREAYREWRENADLIETETQGGMLQLSRRCISYPEQAIREIYLDLGWIPVMKDFGSNYIGLDMNPGVMGWPGQVINFGRDEDEKFVIADSWKEFLILLIYYQNTITLDEETYTVKGAGHFTDWLKNRYLSSGAPGPARKD